MTHPLPGFEPKLRVLEMIAEYQNDRTDAYRERYPYLARVWDELDELRELQNESVSNAEFDDLEDRFDDLHRSATNARDDLQRIWSDMEMPDDVSEALDEICNRLDTALDG